MESGGNLRDGLRLWLASIRRVSADGGTLVVGTVPKVGVGWTEDLDEHDFLTLLQASRVGRLSAHHHARMFGWEDLRSRSLMDRLVRLGLLQKAQAEEWTLQPERMGLIHRALLQRGMQC